MHLRPPGGSSSADTHIKTKMCRKSNEEVRKGNENKYKKAQTTHLSSAQLTDVYPPGRVGTHISTNNKSLYDPRQPIKPPTVTERTR